MEEIKVEETEVVEEDIQETLDDEILTPSNDVSNMFGFSMVQSMGFMASLATIGLAVFGTVFYFMTR